jgi:hypothetical protein
MTRGFWLGSSISESYLIFDGPNAFDFPVPFKVMDWFFWIKY